jgi:hypothetical protein
MLKAHCRRLLMYVFVLACAAPGSSADTDRFDTASKALGAEEYVDARAFFTEDEDIERWYALTFALRDAFDDICGDTFCEGDYINYESLGFRCSVEQAAGSIAQCVWVFAASIEEIEPETGSFDVQGRIWQCRMPLASGTPAASFLHAMTAPGERPLYALLPGSDQSLYDGLLDCL